MTTEEREQYLDTQLENCSLEQKQRVRTQMIKADKYQLFPTDMVFKKWVSNEKTKVELEATPEEVAEVFKHFRV